MLLSIIRDLTQALLRIDSCSRALEVLSSDLTDVLSRVELPSAYRAGLEKLTQLTRRILRDLAIQEAEICNSADRERLRDICRGIVLGLVTLCVKLALCASARADIYPHAGLELLLSIDAEVLETALERQLGSSQRQLVEVRRRLLLQVLCRGDDKCVQRVEDYVREVLGSVEDEVLSYKTSLLCC